MNNAARIFAWIARFPALLAAGLLVLLCGVIVFDVIGRKFFGAGSFKLQELEWHLHGAIAVMGFGYAYTRNAHVRIDVFSSRFSARAQLCVELCAIAAIMIPFSLLLIWYGGAFAQRAFLTGEGSSGGLGLQNRWIIKSALPVSGVVTLCGALSVGLRIIAALRDPDSAPSPFGGNGT